MKYLFPKTSDNKLPTRGWVLNHWTNTNHSDQRINMEREYHFKGTLWQLKCWEEQIAKELFLITSAVFSLPFEAPPGWACRKVRVLHNPTWSPQREYGLLWIVPVWTKDQLLKFLFLKFILHIPPRLVWVNFCINIYCLYYYMTIIFINNEGNRSLPFKFMPDIHIIYAHRFI